jgi:hypothetical protein
MDFSFFLLFQDNSDRSGLIMMKFGKYIHTYVEHMRISCSYLEPTERLRPSKNFVAPINIVLIFFTFLIL